MGRVHKEKGNSDKGRQDYIVSVGRRQSLEQRQQGLEARVLATIHVKEWDQ